MNDNTYSIKGLKSFTGMEGYGFNCSLYENGKKVAFVIDDASGGMVDFQFQDKDAEQRFYDYCKKLPQYEFHGKTFDTSPDVFVSNLVDQFEENRRLKRMCKGKTVFRTKDLGEGEWYTIKTPFGKDVQAHLTKKYGNDLVEIANTRFA